MKKDRQVALLRGINVGRAKRIAMADLRALVEGLGYRDVSTLLNSGNVVFTGEGALLDGTADRIQGAIASRLGITSRVTVLSSAEMSGVVTGNPLLDVGDNHSRLLVAFLSERKDVKRLEPLMKEDWAPEALALGERVAYLWCPDGLLASRLPETIGRLLKDAVTTRTWATVLKLQAMIDREK